MKNAMLKIRSGFMNIKITIKMTVGYFIVVFLPFLLISILYYQKTSTDIFNSFATNKQMIVNQQYGNFQVNLSHIVLLYQTVQYNPSVYDYMSDDYYSVADEVYSYIKYIKPLFEFTKIGNAPLVNDMVLFKIKPGLVALTYDIVSVSKFPDDKKLLNRSEIKDGLWSLGQTDGKDITLNYFRAFYNEKMSSITGYLDIDVNFQTLMKDFTNTEGDVLFSFGSDCYLYKNGTFATVQPSSKYGRLLEGKLNQNSYQLKDGYLINVRSIDELKGNVIMITPRANIIKNGAQYTFLFYIALSLLILSFVYYLIASSITSRITRLSSHIKKKCHNDDLVEYQNKGYGDEVGALITTFNSMVNRINILINKNYKAEIARKEAEFSSLQAQIMPHFIYNTLEGIRMVAEVNNDIDAADMAYTLGRFLRYNVSNDRSEVYITEEIENIKNYLKLYKKRKGEYFDYVTHIHCDLSGLVCPFFILQPIVENCIVHGIRQLCNKGVLTLEISEERDKLIIKITDNGVGIDQDKLRIINDILTGNALPSGPQNGHSSIGIFNINERIKSYYGTQYGISIESDIGRGTVNILTIGKKRREEQPT